MKRRGFFGALFGSAAALPLVALGVPAARDDKGIYVSLHCGSDGCPAEQKIFVDLTKPMMLAEPQCPQCLKVMEYHEDSAQNIKKWHQAHGNKTNIYTPRSS